MILCKYAAYVKGFLNIDMHYAMCFPCFPSLRLKLFEKCVIVEPQAAQTEGLRAPCPGKEWELI